MEMAILFQILLVLAAFGITQASILDTCAQYCRTQIDLLDECSLSPLTDPHNSRPRTTLDDGAEVRMFSSREEANCYCTEGRLDRRCSSCISDQWMEDKSVEETDEFKNWDEYQGDCRRLGFYDDDVIGYPSVTRSAMPTATPNGRVCGEACSLLRGQIEQCQLTPLEKSPRPSKERLTLSYYATVLHNRTAGECTCTIPVLERLPGCVRCLYEDAGRVMWEIGRAYAEDCETLGYRVAAEEQVLDDEDEAESTSTSDGLAKETSPSGNGAELLAGHILAGLVSLCVIACLGYF